MTKRAVHKFGGSSLADSAAFNIVKSIILSFKEDYIVVVSAMRGVTNSLEESIRLAENSGDFESKLEEILLKHQKCIDELSIANQVGRDILNDIETIKSMLNSVTVLKKVPHEAYQFIIGQGEVWSAQILKELLGESVFCANARDYVSIRTCGESIGEIDWEKSLELSKELRYKSQIVATGFIAQGSRGEPAILGRDGSDYSATIFAKLLDAQSVTIWTDVDGVFNADPRLVSEANTVDILSYEEAAELSFFGASVIHPKTLVPILEKKIPVTIKNTFNPSASGTCISDYQESVDGYGKIKGVSFVKGISLITIEGAGMIGVPGIAEKVFSSLKNNEISVVFITQSSSEHSICIGIKTSDIGLAKESLKEGLFKELHTNKIQKITTKQEMGILAIVGNNMSQQVGVASKLFNSLSNSGVNVVAIAQGASERNISVVISEKDHEQALKSVHSAFNLSKHKLDVFVVGIGLVGSTFINQLLKQKSELEGIYSTEFNIVGICNSKKMLITESLGQNWKDEFNSSSVAFSMSDIAKRLVENKPSKKVIIDCTASSEVANLYVNWMSKGINIITPNKKANTSDFEYYKQLRKLSPAKFFYEATVGAGLPVIATLKELIETGDEIIKIQGVFSGTLSYIFNTFSTDLSFSETIKTAKEKGYTEPDPREDLSGMDVARKVLTLGRELGMEFDLDDVSVESLIPVDCQDESNPESFIEKLKKHDEIWDKKIREVVKENQILRYVGTVSKNGALEASVESFDRNHPFSATVGSDNLILFYTKRYFERPLVVQGPGAGAEVTAAGVFSDLIKLTQSFGKSI